MERSPESLSAQEPARILIVDHDNSGRLILKSQLKIFGYRFAEAVSAAEALVCFGEQQPDLVLMDPHLPDRDGYQLTRELRDGYPDDYVPIVFITTIDDEAAIARSADAGADDFLTKPLTPVVLDARIRSALQRRKLYRRLQDQHRALEQRRMHDEREMEMARDIFSRIAHLGCLDEAGIDYVASPLMVFNGDMLLAERTPYGALRVLLGDFTGHGLPAAVGSLPTADIFYGMTAKGFRVAEVVKEINSKLYRLLPGGIFCAAAMIELDCDSGQLEVWNGGLPQLLVYSIDSNAISHSFDSVHPPLGILPPEDFAANVEYHPVSAADSLIAYTDGVVEFNNGDGEMYGEQRLMAALSDRNTTGSRFDAVLADLAAFRGQAVQSDDYTLIEIPCQLNNPVKPERGAACGAGRQPIEWSYQLQLHGSSLARVDPVPLLIQSLDHIQGLGRCREELFAVLTELYNNALDHGVLRLDSSMKTDADGYTDYFRLRKQRLQALQDGSVTVLLRHVPVDQGGRLMIRIEDSGEGFDVDAVLQQQVASPILYGRGIHLVKGLSTSLEYHGGGRIAEAVFEWG